MLLELIFANHFYIFNMRAEIFLVLIIFLSLYFPRNISLYSCIVFGTMKDVFSLNHLGFYIIGFLLCKFVIERLKKRIYPGKIIVDVSLVFIATAVFFLYSSLIINLKAPPVAFQKITLSSIFGSAVYTTMISIPLFLIFKQIQKYKFSK